MDSLLHDMVQGAGKVESGLPGDNPKLSKSWVQQIPQIDCLNGLDIKTFKIPRNPAKKDPH
jgi:hypothetical protein